MSKYTKNYIEGTVLSYDGRVYTFLLPKGETVVLKYSTVHERCGFPSHLMDDGHLKTGATIHLCVIDKDGNHSVLPDHRFYLFSKFKSLPDGTVIRDNDTAALKCSAKAIRNAASLFEQGDTSTAIFLLKAFINTIDKGIYEY